MNSKFLFSLVALGSVPTLALYSQEVQPNILWIVTDDHRADALACWNRATTGQSESALGYVSSPNIDALAAEGVLFANSWCNSSASAPSRASMHTGRYPHHNGIYHFDIFHNAGSLIQPMVPNVMREAGYQTTLFGKMGVRYMKYNDPMRFGQDVMTYDEKITMEGDLERQGISDTYTASGSDEISSGTLSVWRYPNGETTSFFTRRNGHDLTAEDIAKAEEIEGKHQVIRVAGTRFTSIIGGESSMPTEYTLDGRIQHEFSTFMDNRNCKYNILNGREVNGLNTDKPQFINLGFHFPHCSVLPSKEYRDQFLDQDYNIPEFDEQELATMPKQLLGWREHSDITSLTDEQKVQFIRDYYAFCAMGDHLIGEAVDKFKAYCAEKNEPYLIVLTCGDHGWHLGEQGVSCKAANFVKSNQTAVIAVSSDKKKFPAGKVVNDFIEYVDFAPTFIKAAGLDITDERFYYLDGRDLAETVSGAQKPREYTLSEISVSGGYRTYMRSKDFAFSMKNREQGPEGEDYNLLVDDAPAPNVDIMWALECPAEELSMALYDLRVDPQERNNVAYTEEYAKLAEWFRQKLGHIVLGDDRLEVNWNKESEYNISSFAKGCDDKKLNIPKSIIPKR